MKYVVHEGIGKTIKVSSVSEQPRHLLLRVGDVPGLAGMHASNANNSQHCRHESRFYVAVADLLCCSGVLVDRGSTVLTFAFLTCFAASHATRTGIRIGGSTPHNWLPSSISSTTVNRIALFGFTLRVRCWACRFRFWLKRRLATLRGENLSDKCEQRH